MTFQQKFIIVIVSLAALLMAWISFEFQAEEVPFVSVSDLLEKSHEFSQQRFRLGGQVEEGSINYSDDHLTVFFTLKQGESTLAVEYEETALPDLFKDGAEVIVEGAYINGKLNADNLMTKCASRYEEEAGYESPVN